MAGVKIDGYAGVDDAVRGDARFEVIFLSVPREADLLADSRGSLTPRLSVALLFHFISRENCVARRSFEMNLPRSSREEL